MLGVPPESSVKPEEIERRFAAGDCIVERGSVERALFVVHSGEVRIEGASMRRIGQGGVFGELGALLGRPSDERAIAESDVCVLALERPQLERLCIECGEFAVRLARHLGERLATVTAERMAGVEIANADPDLPLLARALLAARATLETPSPVEGGLRELAAAAGLPMRRAYHGVQQLLERRVLRLVDDRLSVIETETLETLAQR